MKNLLIVAMLAGFLSPIANADELPFWVGERKIQGENNLRPIRDYKNEDIYGITRGVAIVETSYGKGFCTGARVGKNLFLTNFHCDAAISCDKVQFRMGYETGIEKEDQQVFKCVKRLATAEEFDYVLYEVKQIGELPNTVEEYPIMTLEAAELTNEMALVIAGHPSGRRKEIDLSENCKLTSVETQVMDKRQTLTHMCDTEGGNSGSPVLDAATGNIIAIHWGGIRAKYNLAVPMSLVLKDIESKVSSVVYSKLNIAD
jgi:serine protease